MDGLSPQGQQALAVAVFVVMVTTGMAIRLDDFRLLLTRRRAVTVGLLSQMLALPLLGFLVAWFLPIDAVVLLDGERIVLGPAFAAGLVLLASCPGGAGSNFLIHAVDGDRALSVSLTALSSVLAIVTIPLYTAVAFPLLLDEASAVTVPVLGMVRQVLLLTVVPVAIGVVFRERAPELARRVQRPSKALAGIVVATIVVGAIVDSWDVLSAFYATVAPPVLALNVLALGTGFAISARAGLRRPERLAVAVETGVQNSPLAIALALTVVRSEAMAVPAGLFGLTMLFTGTVLVLWGRQWQRRPAEGVQLASSGLEP